MKAYNSFDLSYKDKRNLDAIITTFDEDKRDIRALPIQQARPTKRLIHRPVPRRAENSSPIVRDLLQLPQ